MQQTLSRLGEAQQAIREVRTIDDPAVRRLVASATDLADLVDRLSRERVWN